MTQGEKAIAEDKIERVDVSEQAAYEAQQLVSEHSRAESSRLREQAEKEAALLTVANSPLQALLDSDPQAIMAMSALREVRLEEEKRASTRALEEDSSREFSDLLIDVKPEDARALPGSSVFGPPYPFEWTRLGSGAGDARTDKAAGKFRASELVGPTSDYFSSEAALGLALRSPTTVTVRISAYMPISFGTDIRKYNNSLVYVDVKARIGVWRDDQQLVVNPPLATLFELRQPMAQTYTQYGDAYLSDTPIANPTLRMEAGRTYYAWHYGIVGAIGNRNKVSANVDCKLPFIVVAPV